MPQPTGRDFRVDAVNTALLVGYSNPIYIADLIFPYMGVNKRSGIIPQLRQSHFFRDLATKRTPGTKSRRSGYETDLTLTYFCDRYSHGVEVYDEDRDDAAAPFQLDQIASFKAVDVVRLLKNQELLESFTQKVLPIVEKIREDMGLWVIFAVQEDGGGLAVAATHKGLDLSMEVVKRLNAIVK